MLTGLAATIPALVGVAIGALASFLGTFVNEKRKWDRSHSYRWDEQRLIAYLEYSNALRKLYTLSCRLAAGRGLPSDAVALVGESGHQLLAEAELERIAKWQSILLLGSTESIHAGDEANRSALTLEWFARGKLDGDDRWREALKRSHATRDAFVNAARRHLSTGPDIVRQRAWTEDWEPDTF